MRLKCHVGPCATHGENATELQRKLESAGFMDIVMGTEHVYLTVPESQELAERGRFKAQDIAAANGLGWLRLDRC